MNLSLMYKEIGFVEVREQARASVFARTWQGLQSMYEDMLFQMYRKTVPAYNGGYYDALLIDDQIPFMILILPFSGTEAAGSFGHQVMVQADAITLSLAINTLTINRLVWMAHESFKADTTWVDELIRRQELVQEAFYRYADTLGEGEYKDSQTNAFFKLTD